MSAVPARMSDALLVNVGVKSAAMRIRNTTRRQGFAVALTDELQTMYASGLNFGVNANGVNVGVNRGVHMRGDSFFLFCLLIELLQALPSLPESILLQKRSTSSTSLPVHVRSICMCTFFQPAPTSGTKSARTAFGTSARLSSSKTIIARRPAWLRRCQNFETRKAAVSFCAVPVYQITLSFSSSFVHCLSFDSV